MRKPVDSFLVWISVCLISCGCGSSGGVTGGSVSSDAYLATEFESSVGKSVPEGLADRLETDATLVAAANDSLPQVRHAAMVNRKIVYTSSIGLVVENYTVFESTFPTLVTQCGGFVASNRTDRKYQIEQAGTWVVRIPVDQYASFLNGVDSMGFAEARNESAQDVTEEFVDLEARIKNKRELESRVIAVLAERVGKLTDILEIERELSRVREEIERMEGRRRYLADRTSLATLTINCREVQEYEPVTAPSLVNRMKVAWSDSIGAMRFAGENLLVAAIALLPWGAIVVIFGWFACRITRRYWSANFLFLTAWSGSGNSRV